MAGSCCNPCKKDLLHHMRLWRGGKPGGKAPSHNQRDEVLLPKKKKEKIEWDKTRKYKGSKNKVYIQDLSKFFLTMNTDKCNQVR